MVVPPTEIEKSSKHIKTLSVIQSEVENSNRIALSVDCVIFGFDENKLKVLLIRSDLKNSWANGVYWAIWYSPAKI
jgi:hypothetical protein